MKKHIILLITNIMLLVAVAGCADELAVQQLSSLGAFTPRGELVDAYIDLTVTGFSTEAVTRAEGVYEDTEAERKVNDIWVFQYDCATGNLINEPYYQTIEDQKELADLKNVRAQLSDNDGKPCVVYVVANTGIESWVTYDKATAGYPGFNSLDELKRQTIPDPAPIRVVTGVDEDGDVSVPMGGSSGEDGSLVVANGARVKVPVERMFAKLYITVVLKEDEFEVGMDKLMIENISRTCTVATVFNSDGSWYYPESTGDNFEVSRTFVPDETTTDITGVAKTSYGPFVIYVPENYQSDSDDSNAIKLTPYLKMKVPINGEEYAVITPSPSYTAYPGSWDTAQSANHGDNYEIRRNNIYDITLAIAAGDELTPSANCLISTPGQTIAFYPYVRDEEPSPELKTEENANAGLEERYTFSTYLNYSYVGDDANDRKKIKGVKIVWQTQDCIGDNTAGDKVWIDPEPETDAAAAVKSFEEYHRKIYVRTRKAGNALIAAYDDEKCEGNILWSWHIWVPGTGVDPEAGAIEYYHYSWDASGIHTNEYIPGRLVMNLNLGALAESPKQSGVLDHDTYGMLYQWGRKDPFPPMKLTPETPGTKGGAGFYNYADYDLSANNGRNYKVEIGMYDNANKSIDMTGNDGSINGKGKYLFDTNAPSNISIGGDFGATDNAVISSSIQHPTTFIAASPAFTSSANDGSDYDIGNIAMYYNEGDWLPDEDDFLWGGSHPSAGVEYHVYTQAASGAQVTGYSIDAYLVDDYGPNKTIFDPCPYGWRVSPGDLWLGFTEDGLNWEPVKGNASANWSGINVVEDSPLTVATQCGYTMYMQGWQSGATSFFPIQGSRISSGQPYNAGPICGNYHNATVDENMTKTSWNGKKIRRVDILHFHSENKSNTGDVDGEYAFIRTFTTETWYYNKAVAGPVRCVRDTK